MSTLQLERTVRERRISNGGPRAGRTSHRFEWGSAATAEFLDRSVPLDGASHADVARYTVAIPTRYARCFGLLADGAKVELRDSRQFIGWSRCEAEGSFLFAVDGLCIEIQTDPDHPAGRHAPGNVCRLVLASLSTLVRSDRSAVGIVRGMTGCRNGSVRKFVAIDGGQIVLPCKGV